VGNLDRELNVFAVLGIERQAAFGIAVLEHNHSRGQAGPLKELADGLLNFKEKHR
jgi:hypothetical protein